MLELIVLVNGAVIMTLEIVGSRILAPYVGTSIFVWTAMIGVILGALSLGYRLGGKWADKNASFSTLGLLLNTASAFIIITIFTKGYILHLSQMFIHDLRIASTLNAFLLFGPASVFLGTILPYTVKLKLKNIKKVGETVGNLNAISTIGSILGTFLTGFILIAVLGSTSLLKTLALILILLALTALSREFNRGYAIMSIALIILVLTSFIPYGETSNKFEKDSLYNHIEIFDRQFNGELVRVLKLGAGYHSVMSLKNNDLTIYYSKFYNLAYHFNPNLEDVLMIGGGAYSYPKYFLANSEIAKIDVVEIDSELTNLAKEFFGLEESERLNSYHQDGRSFLNENKKQYDAILMDAFNSYSIPFELTTREALLRMNNSLKNDGVIITNIIGSITGENSKFTKAQLATYKEVFPQVYLFSTIDDGDNSTAQNLIIIALKDEIKPSFISENVEYQKMLSHLYIGVDDESIKPLTDDFAPVEQYLKLLDTTI